MAISKSELENALDKIEQTLEAAGVGVPAELDRLQQALEKAALTHTESTAAKDEVERLRQEVTNKLNELRPHWPGEVQDKLDANEPPCFEIDPLNTHEFEIDPDTDLD